MRRRVAGKRKRPGRGWPPGTKISWVTRTPLLCRRRQRNRLVGQGCEISDHIGALAVFLDAGKTHRRAGNEALGIGDELVQIVKSPGAALALHGSREIEPAFALALLFIDGAEQVRADAVGAALLEGMAGRAFLGSGGAFLGGGGPQQLLGPLRGG